MRQAEAARIVRHLLAAFPDATLDEPQVELYTSEVALLADPGFATDAAVELVRSYPRFPAISEFRGAYHTIARRHHQEREREELRALEAGSTPEEKERLRAEVARFADALRLRSRGVDDHAHQLEAVDEGPCQDCGREGERIQPGPGPLLLCRTCAASRMRVAASKDGRPAAEAKA